MKPKLSLFFLFLDMTIYVNMCINRLELHQFFYPPPVGEGGFKSRQDSVRRLASSVTFSCGRKNSKTAGQIFLKF